MKQISSKASVYGESVLMELLPLVRLIMVMKGECLPSMAARPIAASGRTDNGQREAEREST